MISLLGRRQANLCFHFAGSGENLPDIAKSRDTSMDNTKRTLKIEMRLVSFAPGKIEKMETTQTGDEGRYNSGSDYTHHFMRNSQNTNAEVKIKLLFLTW